MENYEQKYKEALEWIHGIYPTLQGAEKEDAEHHFPELKENEDEKIRKEIIDFLRLPHPQFVGKRDHEEWISWIEKQGEQKLLNNDKYQTVSVKILDRLYKSEKELERLKQGEQKPAYNENDENIMKAQLDYWRSVGGKEWYGVPVQETIAWLEKQIEQQPAWSEEDTDMIDHIIRCLKRCGGDMVAPKQPYQKEIDWLKSLKPQTHWKPSEEQMKALIIAVHNAHGHSYHKGIYSLLNDLKKL